MAVECENFEKKETLNVKVWESAMHDLSRMQIEKRKEYILTKEEEEEERNKGTEVHMLMESNADVLVQK